MLTNHIKYTRQTESHERPETLPRLTSNDFCKGEYAQGDRRCYTARLLDIFLPEEGVQYVAAYREFRLATMDYMYFHHGNDRAETPEQRAACFNHVAVSLGYKLAEKNHEQ